MESSFSPVLKFGLGKSCDIQAVNLKSSEAGMSFVVLDNRAESSTQNQEFGLNLFGTYNVLNALGVIVLARYNGIADKTIQAAFDTFQSVRRRQELRGEVNGISVYDDFAHHPTAIRETVTAIRQKTSRTPLDYRFLSHEAIPAYLKYTRTP